MRYYKHRRVKRKGDSLPKILTKILIVVIATEVIISIVENLF